jgi:hypothetical protein
MDRRRREPHAQARSQRPGAPAVAHVERPLHRLPLQLRCRTLLLPHTQRLRTGRTHAPARHAPHLEQRKAHSPAAGLDLPSTASFVRPAASTPMDHTAGGAGEIRRPTPHLCLPIRLHLPDDPAHQLICDRLPLLRHSDGQNVDRWLLQTYLHLQVDNCVHRRMHVAPPFLALGSGTSCFRFFLPGQRFRILSDGCAAASRGIDRSIARPRASSRTAGHGNPSVVAFRVGDWLAASCVQ